MYSLSSCTPPLPQPHPHPHTLPHPPSLLGFQPLVVRPFSTSTTNRRPSTFLPSAYLYAATIAHCGQHTVCVYVCMRADVVCVHVCLYEYTCVDACMLCVCVCVCVRSGCMYWGEQNKEHAHSLIPSPNWLGLARATLPFNLHMCMRNRGQTGDGGRG